MKLDAMSGNLKLNTTGKPAANSALASRVMIVDDEPVNIKVGANISRSPATRTSSP